jgi:predicted amidohydrolase YtcJ
MDSAPPDLVLHNARIYTVDERQPTATALTVRNGRFQVVGTDAEVAEAFPDAPSIDVGGRTVVPGFIDAHAHLQELGHALRRVDLTGTSSPEAVLERLRAFVSARDLEEGTWLRGHGWDDTDWSTTTRPARHLLDDAFLHRPVWLTRTDVHAGWANTAALDATVGQSRLREMSDPDGGRIERDADGRPTGILVDAAMALVQDQIPDPSSSECDRALSAALQHTAERGITGLHDAGVDLNTLRRFQDFIDDDAFPLRVYAMINGRGDIFDHFCERGPLHDNSGRLTAESVKFFADGALGSRGAALLDDYADDPGNRGFLLHEETSFRRHVQRAVECGFQVNTHAIGDRANRFVLDAYEAAMNACTQPVRRPRIEHAQIVAPDDRLRFGALGVIASVQPRFAPSDMDWAPARLGPARIDQAYAWKSLQEAGAPLAFGSDAPVEPIDPIQGFHAAVTRQNADGQPEGGWRPTERLSRSTALHAYTQGAAHAAFREEKVGSITPGTRADFVVLSQDLMRVPAPRLLDTKVVATYLDGAAVYSQNHWPRQ